MVIFARPGRGSATQTLFSTASLALEQAVRHRGEMKELKAGGQCPGCYIYIRVAWLEAGDVRVERLALRPF